MLTIHSCILDSDRLMLRHGDKEIELTRMETRFIAVLGKQLDDWVSERMIRSQVWNEPDDLIFSQCTGKIEAVVARLRRKFRKFSAADSCISRIRFQARSNGLTPATAMKRR